MRLNNSNHFHESESQYKHLDTNIRVGINSRYLNSPLSGIERYIKELLSGIDSRDCVFDQRDISLPRFDGLPNLFFKKIRPYYSAIWDRYMEIFDGRLADIDLFHAPSFIAPKVKTVPTVITIHDLAFLIHPEFFDYKTLTYYKFFLNASIKEASKIICVSEATASDLLRFYPESRKKIRVIYNGFTDFSLIEPNNLVLKKNGLCKDEYILCVGTFNQRKNIQAILAIQEQVRIIFPFMKIVVVGREPKQFTFNQNSSVIFTGHIDDQCLSALYRNAALFVYPSLYEGFGFPMLEAMSVGTPVAYSDVSCLPEIAGLDKCHSFDPVNQESIFQTIIKLLERGRNGVDQDRVQYSLGKYSWERMRTETIEVYKECLR